MTKRKSRLLIFSALTLAAAGLAWKYQDWLMAKVYLSMLEWDGRVQSLQVERVIEALQVEPGQRIVDLGAGTGLFTRPLARSAGEEGVVYAADINAELLKHIDDSARRAGISNIRTVQCAEDDPLLPEPADLIFICDTLHHISERAAYLKTLRRYLKPGGRVAVIDFAGSSPHIMPSMHYSLPELEGWMQEAGYRLLASHDFVEHNFFVIYQCDSCPQ